MPIADFLFCERLVCLDKKEISLSLPSGELGVSLGLDGTLFISDKNNDRVISKQYDEIGDYVETGNLDIEKWNQFLIPVDHSHIPHLAVPPIIIPNDFAFSNQCFAMVYTLGDKRFYKKIFTHGTEQFFGERPIDKKIQQFISSPLQYGDIIGGSSDGKVGTLVEHEGTIVIQDFVSDKEIGSPVVKMEFMPGSDLLLTNHENYGLYLWNSGENKLVRELPIMTHEFATNPAKPTEILYAQKNDLRVFDIETLEDRSLNLNLDIVTTISLAVSQDGRLLASGDTWNGGVHLIDMKTGKYLKRLRGWVLGSVQKVFFTAKNDIIAVSREGYTLFGDKKKLKK